MLNRKLLIVKDNCHLPITNYHLPLICEFLRAENFSPVFHSQKYWKGSWRKCDGDERKFYLRLGGTF